MKVEVVDNLSHLGIITDIVGIIIGYILLVILISIHLSMHGTATLANIAIKVRRWEQ